MMVTVLSSHLTNLNMKFIPVAIAKGPNYIVQLVLSQFPLSCDVHVVLSTKFRLLHTDVHTYMCKYVCTSYMSQCHYPVAP